MASINRVLLVGHLGRDPELRHTQGGTAVCEFSIAVNSREKQDGEWVDHANWVDIRVWEAQGESCAQYLRKGSQVGIDGRLRLDKWQNKAGENRSKLVVVASAVQFLDSKGERPAEEDAPPPGDADF